jgi:hypothetical protein
VVNPSSGGIYVISFVLVFGEKGASAKKSISKMNFAVQSSLPIEI